MNEEITGSSWPLDSEFISETLDRLDGNSGPSRFALRAGRSLGVWIDSTIAISGYSRLISTPSYPADIQRAMPRAEARIGQRGLSDLYRLQCSAAPSYTTFPPTRVFNTQISKICLAGSLVTSSDHFQIRELAPPDRAFGVLVKPGES
jgi:hypothetical protein